MRYPQIAARLFETPLMVWPRKLQTVLRVLGPRMGFVPPAKAFEDDDEVGPGDTAPLYARSGRAAVINVFGSLVHRADLMDAMSGLTSYQALGAAFRQALVDDDIERIVLSIDSPGGEAAGVFDFADEIYAARGTKPIVAVANDAAMSAAYLIASAADEVVVTQTGYVGSIGVVAAHLDQSRALDGMGLTVTLLFAGERKVDGNSAEPLSDRARDDWQADIDRTYALFTAAVARNRNMAEEDVIATQAAWYAGERGIADGLADRLGTLAGVLMEQAGESPASAVAARGIIRADAAHQETSMTTPTAAPAGTASAELETLRAQVATMQAERDKARLDASSAERVRCQAILGSDEAKGRGDLASHLAFATSMTADEAKALLAKAPTEKAEARMSPLDAAMRGAGNPAVGADAAGQGDDEAALADRALAAAGYKPFNGRA